MGFVLQSFFTSTFSDRPAASKLPRGTRFSNRLTSTTSLLIVIQMAHPRSDENLHIPTLPLALAFTILKTKPIEYSVRGENLSCTHFTNLSDSSQLLEYIDKLRQQCQVGERNVNHSTIDKYLDAVVHWKERFKDSQVEIRCLQGRLVQLEHEIETLKSTSTVSRDPKPSNISRSKQKRASRDEPNAAPSKRTKASSGSITPNDHLYKPIEEDFQTLGTSDYGEYEYDESNFSTFSLVLIEVWQAKQFSITYGKRINLTRISTQTRQYWHIISTKLHTMSQNMLQRS